MDKPTRDAIHQDLANARDELETARILHRERKYRQALSRAYYAVFYAATGTLESKRIKRAKHSGVQSAFGQFLVKPKIIEDEFSNIYARVRESRENQIYQKLVFRNDRLIGAVMVGDISAVGLINHLMQSQKPVGAIKDALLGLNAPYYSARRAWFKPEMEGVNLPWRESLSSTEHYEKHFDDAKWAERERDERKW